MTAHNVKCADTDEINIRVVRKVRKMDLRRHRIGCEIFFDEEDDPEIGTVCIEYTDRDIDEFGIFVSSSRGEANIYVTFELWKTLYQMAMREKENMEKTVAKYDSDSSSF